MSERRIGVYICHCGGNISDYVDEPDDDLDPGRTNIPGVFVAGAAAGAKDIVDSITHAGAAVSQVAAYLERRRNGDPIDQELATMELSR